MNKPMLNIGTIKRLLKHTGATVLYNSGILTNFLKLRSKKAVLILAYHRLSTKDYIHNNSVMPGMYVSDETFALHMKWLSENYKMVSVSDVINRLNSNDEWADPVCAITFDDGWHDNYIHAFPILKEYKIPATIFIIGNMVGASEPNCWDLCFEIVVSRNKIPENLSGFKDIDDLMNKDMYDRIEQARRAIHKIRALSGQDFDKTFTRLRDYYYEALDTDMINKKYRMLSWEEMCEMQKYGINFGYHSRRHYMLTKLPDEKLDNELMIPFDVAKRNGVLINNIFCYPDSQYNDKIINRLIKIGYLGATTLSPGFNHIDTDPYQLRRINIHEGSTSTLSQFLALIASTGN